MVVTETGKTIEIDLLEVTESEKTEDGEVLPFKDDTDICLPPSFAEFMRDKDHWLRPGEYLREVLAERELTRLKAERKKQ